ncbi:hypothetical protein D3C71_1280240 [compost metagenome]
MLRQRIWYSADQFAIGIHTDIPIIGFMSSSQSCPARSGVGKIRIGCFGARKTNMFHIDDIGLTKIGT